MSVQRHHRTKRFFGAALVLICFCALVPGIAAVNVATGSFQVASVGETVSIPVILDSASGGISGYRITVSLSDQSVATITAVAFPDWAGLKSASPLPSRSVILQGVDLSQQVPLGGAGVLLATLTVKGTATGSTNIVITPDPSMGIQNRNGDQYAVTTSMGTLNVGTLSPGAPPTPLPTPTTGVPTAIPTGVVPTAGVLTPIPTTGVPTAIPTPGVPTPDVPATGEPTPMPTATVLTPIPTGTSPTPIPTSDSSPVYPVAPIATSVPGTISPGGSSGITTPAVITPGVQPTFGTGKRYAIGNPGSFIGTRFGSSGIPTDTVGPGAVTGPEATLKPGSRAYGITPPTGKFIRWYPAARWKAGIK